jgi:hypothetical protein
LATAPAPSVCDAPERFSMTTVWPICRDTCSNTSRATRSMALPAVSGTITWIGCRAGHAWACDGEGASASRLASTAATTDWVKRRPICRISALRGLCVAVRP